MRKSFFKFWLITCAALLLPAAAHAVGLGKLNVLSGLGQPLRAEIDLVSLQKDEISSLEARLASPEAFRQANIDFPPALATAKLSIEKRSNGQYYIKVTSIKAIEEPFLDILVELNWSAGRIVREYTSLLDPPGFGPKNEPVAPIVAPVARNEQPTGPTVRERSSRRRAASGSDASINAKGIPQPDKPVNGATNGQTTADSKAGGTYGPVKKGDTLAKIAREVKPEGVSLEQALVGIYRHNSDAFINNNMNRLKTGQILKLPEPQAYNAISESEAAKEIKVQTQDWGGYRRRLASEATASKSEQADRSSSGRISSTVTESKSAAEKSGGKVTLSSGADAPAGAVSSGGRDAQSLKARLDKVEEERVAADKARKEAESRVNDLQKLLADTQKALQIRNDEIARLQNQANANKSAAGAPATATPPASSQPSVPSQVVVAPVTPETTAKSSTPSAPSPSTASSAPEAVAPPTAEMPKPAPIQSEAPAPQPEQPAAAKPTEEKKPRIPPPAPEPEPGIIDKIISTPLYLGGILAAFFAILAGVWYARRSREAQFNDSLMAGSDLRANTVFGDSAGGVVNTGDNSLMTDFGKVGLGHIDTDEVDPLAEAEVYIAYGRDAQAEEILKEALLKDPQRYEIHLKLLEIYAGRKNPAAYETLAGELYAATGGQGAIWAKAAEMGYALDPENPLYTSAKPASEKIEAHKEEATADLASSDLDLNLDLVEPSHAKTDVPIDLSDIDKELEKTMILQPGQVSRQIDEEALAHAKADSDLDFNLDLGGDKGLVPDISIDAVNENDSSFTDIKLDTVAPPNSIDFDFNRPAAAAPAMVEERPVAKGNAREALDLGLELDLDSVSDKSSKPEVQGTAAFAPNIDLDVRGETPKQAQHIELADINLDLGASDATTAEDDGEGKDDSWFDVQTKFDLAKAYQEMGDKEGAREILQEVMAEGDAQQKAEAKALFASLN